MVQISHHLTHFKEPALSIWIKECQREVVPIIHWDFERFAADARVQALEDEDRRECQFYGRLYTNIRVIILKNGFGS